MLMISTIYRVFQLIERLKQEKRSQGVGSGADSEVFDSNGDGTAGYFIYAVDNNGEFDYVSTIIKL